MANQDMLAFTFRIQKIIRDMKYIQLHHPEEEEQRASLVAALEEVKRRIQQDFE